MDQDRDGSSPGRGPDGSGQALARGLCWFSIGLAEVLAPRHLARAAGIDDREEAVRACGILEIAMGVGILGSDNPAPWIWSRVAGDALDVAILAAGLGADNPRRGNVELALAVVAGVAAVDVWCARSLGTERAALAGSVA